VFGSTYTKDYKLPIISWILLVVVTTIIARYLLCKYPAWNSKKKDNNGHPNKPRHEKWFYVWLIGLSTLGGFWALFLPLALNQKFDGPTADGNQLRLHLLYITGGVLALTTLGETHRKNTLEKHKNDQDHTRQVHAERRSRYTTAIEQLSSDKASIRLGGVYTLVGLVDEWLADEKTTPSLEERRKEGQVIINNLCAYIRSPFLLAERAEQLDEPYTKDLQKDFGGDKEKFDTDKQTFKQLKATLEEERQVRQSIIKEIRERLGNKIESGSWSDFDYDFLNAYFFYVVSFNHSYFSASLNFAGAKFTRDTSFSLVTFAQNTNFSLVTFAQDADFSGAKFIWDVDFSEAKFTDADFSRAEFTWFADFSRAEFNGSAKFFKVEFTEHAYFPGVRFTRRAYFSKTTFIRDAYFSQAIFNELANFSEVKFTKDANFSEVKFTKDASFSGAKFTKGVSFSEATFKYTPIFVHPLFSEHKAKFSYKANPEDYNFEVSHDSPYKIETEEQEHNGIKFIIPKGTILFA